MKKLYVVIPVYGGVIECDRVKASFSRKKAKGLLKEADDVLGIKRDHKGKYDHPENDAYLVDLDIDESDNMLQVVTCPKCNNWEEMPADEARDKFHSFNWIRDCDEDCTAIYACTQCDNYVKSEIREAEEEDDERKLYLQVTSFHNDDAARLGLVALSESEYERYLENATPGECITLLEEDVVRLTLDREPSFPFDK